MTTERFSAVEIAILTVVLLPILYVFVVYPSIFAFDWKDVVGVVLYLAVWVGIVLFTKSRKRSTSP